MDCDICGKPAVGEAIIEGAKVSVCDKCISYGRPVKVRPAERSSLPPHINKVIERKPSEFAVIDGYGLMVSEARERQGLSREELANKLFIREHDLSMIEQEKRKPDEKISRKLEQFLHISLLERASEESSFISSIESGRKGNKRGPLTLADIVDIKKGK